MCSLIVASVAPAFDGHPSARGGTTRAKAEEDETRGQKEEEKEEEERKRRGGEEQDRHFVYGLSRVPFSRSKTYP